MTVLSLQNARVRLIPRSPADFLNDIYHVFMTVYWGIRLMLNRMDTKPTYRYCWHLDRTTYFRSRYVVWLAADPKRVDFWLQPRLFIDYMPDEKRLESFAEGTVGKAYSEMCKRRRDEGLLDLRRRRLEVNTDEAKGLDLEGLKHTTSQEDLFERIRARRNIFMTSTHDFCHMITGSDTEVSGEAVVARYQFNSLVVPQNWLNMVLALLVETMTLDWGEVRRITRRFPAVDAAKDYWPLDFEAQWNRPVRALRQDLGLPPDGFLPDDEYPGPAK